MSSNSLMGSLRVQVLATQPFGIGEFQLFFFHG